MKAFKLRDLMIQVQPNAPEPLPCQPGAGPTICSPTVCHAPTILCQACSVIACSIHPCTLTACSLHPCTVNVCSAHPCSAFVCSANPCSVFACSAHACSVFACSAHPCSVFACSAHPCSANVCSAHPCSANVCSAHPCSVLVCSAHPCSVLVCSNAVVSICHNPSLVTCIAASVPITITGPTDPGPTEMAGGLQMLREQLKQQLAALDQQDQANQESMKPQTVEEVDDLHQKLQGAMDELRTRRGELEQLAKDNAAQADRAKGKEPGK